MFGFFIGIAIAVAVGVFIGNLALRSIENIIENFFGF